MTRSTKYPQIALVGVEVCLIEVLPIQRMADWKYWRDVFLNLSITHFV